MYRSALENHLTFGLCYLLFYRIVAKEMKMKDAYKNLNGVTGDSFPDQKVLQFAVKKPHGKLQ